VLYTDVALSDLRPRAAFANLIGLALDFTITTIVAAAVTTVTAGITPVAGFSYALAGIGIAVLPLGTVVVGQTALAAIAVGLADAVVAEHSLRAIIRICAKLNTAVVIADCVAATGNPQQQ